MAHVRSGARAVVLTDLADHVPILAANADASLGAVSAARARLGIHEGADGYRFRAKREQLKSF